MKFILAALVVAFAVGITLPSFADSFELNFSEQDGKQLEAIAKTFGTLKPTPDNHCELAKGMLAVAVTQHFLMGQAMLQSRMDGYTGPKASEKDLVESGERIAKIAPIATIKMAVCDNYY